MSTGQTIVLWALIAVHVLAVFVTIGTVGRERKPNTPGDAVVIVIIDVLLIAGILYVAGVL